MHSVSVNMNENEFSLLDSMAKQSHKSRAEIMREALRAKVEYEEYKLGAIDEGIRSAEDEPLTSHEDAMSEFADFRREYKERNR